MTIEQWVEENCKRLGVHIKIHLEEMCPILDEEERWDTWRMIMISIRSEWKRREKTDE